MPELGKRTEPEYQPAIYAINDWLNGNGINYTPEEVANEIGEVFGVYPVEFDKDRLISILEGPKKPIGYSLIVGRLQKFIKEQLEIDSQDFVSREQSENRPMPEPILAFIHQKSLA